MVMKMKNINLKVKGKSISGMPFNLAIENENLQSNLIFNFDEFVDGIARLEYKNSTGTYYTMLNKVDRTYELPIKSIMTVKGTPLRFIIRERKEK